MLLLLAAAPLAARAAMNTDRTLGTSGATCVSQFDALMAKHYAAPADAKCAKLVRGMLSTADPAKCPDADSAPGSAVQKCMGKSKESSEAWETFVKKCEVMNVANVSPCFFCCRVFFSLIRARSCSFAFSPPADAPPHSPFPPPTPRRRARTPKTPQRQGEAEAAADRKPSCMPAFANIEEFEHWLMGHDESEHKADKAAAAKSGAGAAAAASAAAAAFAALAVAAF